MENQAYISRVHLKGYKSIIDMTIDFKSGLNIIIGPNGSGKTNFLECIEQIFLQELSTINTTAIIDIFDTGFLQLQYKTENYGINRKKNGIKTDFVLKKNGIEIGKDSFLVTQDNQKIYFNRADEKQLMLDWTLLDPRISLIKYGIEENFSLFLSNNFTLMVAYGNNENALYFNGQFNILDFNLSEIFNEIVGEFQSISRYVKDCLEQIRVKDTFQIFLNLYTPIQGIKINKDKIRTPKYNSKDKDLLDPEYIFLDNIELLFQIEGIWLYWSQLSDGTKRLFFLFVRIYASKEASIAIEEPELGIHPDQLKKLMQFLKEQAKEKQIIITTHSPQVLNILSEDELDHIITTRYDAEKGTTMHHLTEEQKQVARNYIEEGLSLGDAWVYSTQFEQATEEEEIG